MIKFVTLVNGIRTLVNAISSSAGIGDANKIVSTSTNGKLDATLMPPTVANLTDITNATRYGNFTGLKSNYYLLGTDINIVPVIGGQSAIQAYWGLQLGGMRPQHRFTPSFVEKDPPEVFGIEAADSFCVGIQAQSSNPTPSFTNGVGITKAFSVLNLYGTTWHTNGHFLNCKNASYTSIFNVNLLGEVSINNLKVLGARNTGWTPSTGTALKEVFNTETATTLQNAQRIKALEDALRSHGLIN